MINNKQGTNALSRTPYVQRLTSLVVAYGSRDRAFSLSHTVESYDSLSVEATSYASLACRKYTSIYRHVRLISIAMVL